MRSIVPGLIAFLICTGWLQAEDTALTRTADGFQIPVSASGNGEGYYIARGYRPNGHLGEDWNGVRGGDTDLGDPVYATANGVVVFAKNYHVGWGNVVIIRHAYYEGSDLKFVDSLYGHLLQFTVVEGQQVKRGQQIGQIGNNFGMYEAHLHFEMRKNLQIGMFRSSFPRDFSNYWSPHDFVAEHRTCPKGGKTVAVPINTFPPVAPPVLPGPKVETPMFAAPAPGTQPSYITSSSSSPLRSSSTTGSSSSKPAPTPKPKGAAFRVDRFEDLRGNGY